MKPEEMARWEKVRALGMWRYVLLYGVIAWGAPMFVLMTFVVNPFPTFPELIWISAGIWAIGGALFGTTMWWFAERRYRKALASRV